MEVTDFNSGKALQTTLVNINAVQAKNAVTGAKVSLSVVDADNVVQVNQATIIAAIGQSAYNTIVANTLTALNTALASAETTADTAFSAL